MDTNDALITVFARNSFYRRQYYLALCAVCLSIIVIAVLSWILAYLLRNPPRPLYFATDSVGRLIQDTPVNQPNMTTEEVIAWTIEAVETAYSYDFVNYRAQLQGAQKYFTNYGWTNYMRALQASNNLLALTQRKMVFIARVVDKPKVLAEGILGGAYAYKFQMPMLVTYQYQPFDEKSQYSNPLQITVIVQRQKLLQSYKGLGILQIIGEMAITTPAGAQPISATPTG